MKRLLDLIITLVILLCFVFITCEKEPTKVPTDDSSPPTATISSLNKTKDAHSDIPARYKMEKFELGAKEKSILAQERAKHGIADTTNNNKPENIKLLALDDYGKYNISIPTELELMKKAKSIGQQKALSTKSSSDCQSCFNCHEIPPDWYWYWYSDIQGFYVPDGKLVKCQSASVSSVPIEYIAVASYVWCDYIPMYSGSQARECYHFAGVSGSFTYPDDDTYLWEIFGEHFFSDSGLGWQVYSTSYDFLYW